MVETALNVNVAPTASANQKNIVRATESELKSFLTAGKAGKFDLSHDYLSEKEQQSQLQLLRALFKQQTADGISMQSADLVLERAGAIRKRYASNQGNVNSIA